MNLKDLPLSLRLVLQVTAIVSNFYLIVSFSDSGFSQPLTQCDIESSTFVFLDVRDQVLRKD